MAAHPSSVRLDMKGLNLLQRRLMSNSVSEVQIGIFAGNDARPFNPNHGLIVGKGKKKRRLTKSQCLSNVKIGYWHEFGTQRQHKRSFLINPLEEHLREAFFEEINGVEDLLDYKDGILQALARAAYKTVMRAFDTFGFGRWPLLAPKTIKSKTINKDKILTEFGLLRKAIDYRIAPLGSGDGPDDMGLFI